ncbi:MAG TPA: TetR/AcrR family transcriptional regulator [Nitriliruptorales bacterium]
MRPDQADTRVVADGRRLRAVRNRELVIEAILDLFDEGNLDFDAPTLAERAGVSVRSVYRYFEDRDSLVRAGVAKHAERLGELLRHDVDLDADLQTRISQFLDYRLALYPQVETVVRVARHYARRLPDVGDTLAGRRATVREQLTDVFGPELGPAGSRRCAERLAALDAATDFDTWRLLRDDHGLDDDAIHRIMARTVHRELATPSAPPNY